MTPDRSNELRRLDQRHLWHPFTPMQAWCAPDHDPLILTRGEGPWLTDSEGGRYLDGNSSIWTNIHGHNHPRLNAAIEAQLRELAHCSALGYTNEPAIELARRLVEVVPGESLARVFFSDDGSTAMECACKMALQYWQLKGVPDRNRLLAFDGAYHGDTMGAASLGGIATFQERFASWGFDVERIADLKALEDVAPDGIAAVAIEPLIQGANRMQTWPAGLLAKLRQWCDETGVLLICDEVMTGFGRTGTLFASEQEGVVPDLLALAKGLTGGYLPLAATLATEPIFEAFLGPGRTFYYGHSYCANPLGCAAALANLDIFEREDTLAKLPPKIDTLRDQLRMLESHPRVTATRQCGFIGAIDTESDGAGVCLAARKHGLLTRPILNTVVLMLPLCVEDSQIESAAAAIRQALGEVEP